MQSQVDVTNSGRFTLANRCILTTSTERGSGGGVYVNGTFTLSCGTRQQPHRWLNEKGE
ncbi:hypothetical protein O0S10_03930 [Methanocorpusculum sp. MG]|uniref:Uncharacterized protein n=1 Tax=Methanocorpusculum petauri TaxID=3002863 RepID=A0ABT4IF67_9EURY|nr:hypothetical protein [Methanocorpusculum petauri]MCZ0860378.1 hypothetical protein [Methanocorpusculum petauri]